MSKEQAGQIRATRGDVHTSHEVHKIPAAAWGFSEPGSSGDGEGRTFKRILLAVNNSDACMRAVSVVAGLARGTYPEVCVVHLVERVFLVRVGWCAMETADDAKRIVHRFRTALESLGVGVTARTGNARREALAGDILLTAGEYRADVIVIGTPHKSRLRTILCGSVSNEIIRKSRIPVVAVP